MQDTGHGLLLKQPRLPFEQNVPAQTAVPPLPPWHPGGAQGRSDPVHRATQPTVTAAAAAVTTLATATTAGAQATTT